MLYTVIETTLERRIVRSGPAAGCLGFENYHHTAVFQTRRRAEAIARADAAATRAHVVEYASGETIYSTTTAVVRKQERN